MPLKLCNQGQPANGYIVSIADDGQKLGNQELSLSHTEGRRLRQ